MFTNILLLLFSFLCGAIPFGYIISMYIYKTDITKAGSGNFGATNVMRVLGKLPGGITLLLDIFKGYLPTIYSVFLFKTSLFWPCCVGIASVCGHVFNPFLRLKGGKGVATALGVFLAITPVPIASALAVFLITVSLTRYVSLGSITGAFVLVIGIFVLYTDLSIRITSLVTALLIIIKHHTNIRRLLTGNENKLRF